MASGRVVVPWEHWVCTRCLEDNQYAVWLIKLKCFKPRHRQHYYPGRKTLVSIDPSAMRLVKMRPHPVNIEMSSIPIQLCQSYPRCQYRDNCPRPHSQVEYETWEFIRTLFKGWWWDIKHVKPYCHLTYWVFHVYQEHMFHLNMLLCVYIGSCFTYNYYYYT